MLSDYFTTTLIGLKDVLITNVKENEDGIFIELKTLSKPSVCPQCKQTSKYVYDYRVQRIKDLGYRDKHVYLLLKKRRYICKHCNKRFYEKYAFLPRYHRMTQRVYENVIRTMRENFSMKSVSKMFNISQTTVARIFDIVNYGLYKLPETIALDEFKGNAGNEKYQAIITNPDKKKVLDILPNRAKTCLIDYFKRFNGRNSVKYVVMDMWKPYYEISKWLFPNAKIIVDKYHYVRQVYWALDRVRKRVQKRFITEKRIYFKHSKRLLFAEYSRLNIDNQYAVKRMLDQHDDLYVAWQLKELFIEFRRCNSSDEGKKILKQWILMAQESELEEFKDCTTAFLNWFKFILNSLDYPYSNGFTEGINNKIKVLKRNAYGYRNFERFRNRILHCTA